MSLRDAEWPWVALVVAGYVLLAVFAVLLICAVCSLGVVIAYHVLEWGGVQ